MALPSAYLTSFKNVDGILAAMQSAQAPGRFTQKFLEGLGFANSNDRLFINMLKALGFLNDTGVPTKRYHGYLDQTQSQLVMAEALREAYGDLFQVNVKAQDMSTADVKNKMKTLSEGQFSDRVLTQMAGTFKALSKRADFSGLPAAAPVQPKESKQKEEKPLLEPRPKLPVERLGGLSYNINIHLPESRDQSVYDALFKSLREHLLD
jgi:Family of unknown function (DUF5343)